MNTLITWDNFATFNQDSRGIRFKFEDLCRQLFLNENLLNNVNKRYLHGNPNNAGLETDPIFDEKHGRRIGFQAKYFDSNVDYKQIERSAAEIVKHYAGQVDYVFLYCNKPLDISASGYKKTIRILNGSNITLELITDNAILDLVRKYPYLGLYYFGNHTIDFDWFKSHSNRMFDEIGERYNRDFNVNTEYNNALSLFVHDRRAIEYINKKKETLQESINKRYLNNEDYHAYLKTLEDALANLRDIDRQTIFDSFKWKDILISAVSDFQSKLIAKKEKLCNKKDVLYNTASEEQVDKENREKARRELWMIKDEISTIESFIRLPDMVEITNREMSLLRGNILTVSGNAGTGKTQLLSYETKQLLDDGRDVLFLVAGTYYDTKPIQNQIMDNLRLEYSFEELIDVLEAIGEKEDYYIPVFIDAINETWIKRLWMSGLPTIIEKIKQSPRLKLVVTYRSEYEKILIPESMLKDDEIVSIIHQGFEDNSIPAVKEFLNYYNIPFTPLEYFGYEMANPLFLTLYCRTYNGDEVSLPTLYERLINNANTGIYKAMEKSLRDLGYSAGEDILRPLIVEMAKTLVTNGVRFISKDAICGLKYWGEYGITPVPFINHLIKEHILRESIFKGQEKYYFAYDQMNDYYCAKALIDAFNDKTALRKHLATEILSIKNGQIGKIENADLFVNVCALYAEKYGEECFDIISSIEDDSEKQYIFSKYIATFQWRDGGNISAEHFFEMIKQYHCSRDDLWPVLIGNSAKETNPLNADFLHKLLSSYELNKRDYLWTVYINDLPKDDTNRIIQLIRLYDGGEMLDIKSEKQVELLLTLFGWLLTSSNRWLRDYASKAMIELFKEHFPMCQTILEKFEKCDDPYVIQRLYGIVFGACCKKLCSEQDNYKILAEYVYNAIFCKEKVYPDILLRDYARLIIEKFLYDNPEYCGIINHAKIVPPYNSEPIPEIEDQHYLDKDCTGATSWIIHSMCFDGLGMYGDFGRYIYQSALRNFDVDQKKIFNYSVYFIFNELGFSEKYFEVHDKHCGSFNRRFLFKTERIGKKYQWIAMYNILARVSDHYKMINEYGSDDTERQYNGTWDMYVRDFDPTLNLNFMKCENAPEFKDIKQFVSEAQDENRQIDISNINLMETWLSSEGIFQKNLKNILLLNDGNGVEWVALSTYIDTGTKNLDTEKLLVWSWLYAYFVTSDQKEMILETTEKGLSIISHDIASHNQTYTVFNREYPWAPSCAELKKYEWVEATVKTGEKQEITIPALDIDLIMRYGNCAGRDECYSEDSEHFIHEEMTREVDVEKEIGDILHASSCLVWEEEFDATKESAISYDVPCSLIIEQLNLKQQKEDGVFYDSTGRIAAFNTSYNNRNNIIVIRRDILDEFLSRNNMELIWLVQSEKQIHATDRSIKSWSEWEGVFAYSHNGIEGRIKRMQ